MNCATCRAKKISPKTAPHGGFLCGNEHLQCGECDLRGAGRCGVCEASTTFVQMNLHGASCMAAAPTTASAPQVRARGPTPSAPEAASVHDVASSERNVEALASNTSYMFPKSFFADLETQSSISQEHLSMQDSHDRLSTSRPPRPPSSADQANPNANDTAAETGHEGVQPEARPHPERMQLQATTTTSTSPPLVTSKSFTKIQFPSPAMSALERAQMETLFFGANPPPNSASTFTLGQLRQGGRGAAQAAGSRPTVTVSLASGPRDPATPEEPEDSHMIHTSEIRFMESTESLKNYYSGGTMHPSLKQRAQGQEAAAEEHQQQQQVKIGPPPEQEALSAKALQEFESRNTASPGELVENYLRSYGPLAVCHFPAYSFNHNCYHGGVYEGWSAQQRQALMRSICVSTESEPSLAGNNPNHPSNPNNGALGLGPGKFLPPDYFVMTATGVPELPSAAAVAAAEAPGKGQTRHSLDLRMQKVLETFQEDPGRQVAASEKPPPPLEQSKNFLKMPAQTDGAVKGPAATGVGPVATSSAPQAKPGVSATNGLEEQHLDLAAHLSNSHRAFYNPPSHSTMSEHQQQLQHQQQASEAKANESLHSIEPQPQFQIISWPLLAANELLLARERYASLKPMPACQLNIPRSPIQCPESACQRMIFVSDFNKHLVVDHSKLPMERIAPRQCKNFFIDPRLSHVGMSRCHLLYLIRDKITDLGSSKFKDFLPLLVMSSRVRLAELCGDSYAHSATTVDDLDFLMIWLTGIVPEEFPVSVSLTVWPRSGLVPTCHLVHSGEMYSIRKSQLVSDICHSGQMLLLSPRELQLLTNNGKDMLELQIVVH